MGHDYSSVTKSDNTYTPVSDVTLSTVEDKLTWAYLNTLGILTWDNLSDSGKVHWCDWYFGIYTDAWDSLTTPSATYSEVTV